MSESYFIIRYSLFNILHSLSLVQYSSPSSSLFLVHRFIILTNFIIRYSLFDIRHSLSLVQYSSPSSFLVPCSSVHYSKQLHHSSFLVRYSSFPRYNIVKTSPSIFYPIDTDDTPSSIRSS